MAVHLIKKAISPLNTDPAKVRASDKPGNTNAF
jgi:hypothetical protein